MTPGPGNYVTVDNVPLEKHYVPKRSQRTRSVLTFFAQDHASTEMVYANADVTKTAAAREVIAFADYWAGAAGTDPGLLVFDSQLTTYAVLDELSARGIRWLTLRQRGRAVLAELAALPASAWTSARIQRSGRYRHAQLHDELTTIKGIGSRVRQIAVANIGRDEPTLLITNDHATPAKALFTRYAERMLVENELDAHIGGFHLDALSSGLPLNVDVDTTLTVLAGNLYRLLARTLPRYQQATPDRLLPALHRRHRETARHRRRRHCRPRRPHLPPGAHRHRLRRPHRHRPMVGRAHPAVPVPTTLNLSATI